MQGADFDLDGWCLDSGVERHLNAPDSFLIPTQLRRESLEVGDFAKLIFRIAVDNPLEPVAVERMWVIVFERTEEGYRGILDNEPTSIAKNDEFWLGTLICFSAEHVIDMEEKDDASMELARETLERARYPSTFTGGSA